jgi:CHAT domain-containing protein/Tfp pilus assembly protein PilF
VLELAKDVAKHLGEKKLLALTAYTAYRIGAAHAVRGNNKAAMDAYLLSKETFEEAKSPRDLICVLSALGDTSILEADYDKAEKYSKESLALAESLENAKEAAAILPDQYGIAYAWSNLGQVYKWKGEYKAALTSFQESLALWEKLNREGLLYRPHIVSTLTHIGMTYRVMGYHIQALNYLGRALELARAIGDKSRLADVLANIAVLYIEQSDYTKASELLNQNLQIFIEVNNRREVASTLINMGVINQRLKNHGPALEEFQKALKIAEEISAFDKVVTAQEGLGTVCYQQGKYAEALEWFDRAWSLARTIGDKVRMTELLWRKGQVFYAQGEYLKSGDLADSAANLAIQLRLPIMSYLSLTLRGKAYRAQKAPELTVKSFTQAIEEVERMRAQVAGGEKEQQIFFEDKISPYHEMVSLLVEQNEVEEALKFAERAKARVLLDVLRNGRVKINRRMGENELSEERRLYSDLVSLNAQVRVERMRQQPDYARIDELENRLQKARNAYEAFQTALYAAHPELKAKRGLLPPFVLEEATALIQDYQSAILEYVVTEDQTFLFLLTKSPTRNTRLQLDVYSIEIKKSLLSDIVKEFRDLLSVNHPGFRSSGRRLYDLLIRPAEQALKGKTSVCFVPDDLLWELPFQALQAPSDQYLLELYAIHYAPSLQVLGEMRKKATDISASPVSKRRNYDSASIPDRKLLGQLYAVGNPAFGGDTLMHAQTVRNTPFVSLPETEKEVQAIGAEVYGSKASSVHVGTDAREDVVKAEMDKYRIVHFATHGVLDDRNPLYSYLLLATDQNSKEDGLLEARELMEMELSAEMVVLSACDTARGYVSSGEGIIGMTWALHVAGVPTILASQWKVPSETTTKLMVAFHTNITQMRSGKRMSKAEAWRQAALEMIKDPRYRMKPFYWGGFVVVGNGGM